MLEKFQSPIDPIGEKEFNLEFISQQIYTAHTYWTRSGENALKQFAMINTPILEEAILDYIESSKDLKREYAFYGNNLLKVSRESRIAQKIDSWLSQWAFISAAFNQTDYDMAQMQTLVLESRRNGSPNLGEKYDNSIVHALDNSLVLSYSELRTVGKRSYAVNINDFDKIYLQIRDQMLK